MAASRTSRALKTMTKDLQCCILSSVFCTRLASKEAIQDFLKRVCTTYSGIARTQVASYCNRMNALFADAWLNGKYVSVYSVRLGENGYPLVTDGTTRHEERGDCPSSRSEGDSIIEIVSPSPNAH